MIIDTPWNTSKQLSCLKSSGVEAIIRYYAKNVSKKLPEKRLTPNEARAISKAGLKLAVVYEGVGSDPDTFSYDAGLDDCAYARKYASETIGQPENSGIYFAVDYDATDDIDTRIVPYFEGVRDSMANGTLPRYRIGVYGGWNVCDTLVKKGLATFNWLAQSRGWGGKEGYKKYRQSDKWTLAQEFPSTEVCDLDVDKNQLSGSASDFGQFVIAVSGEAEMPGITALYRVIAHPGLRLRAGPGTGFDKLALLPFGTTVRVVKRAGDWAFVALGSHQGVDGAVHADFLEPAG